MSVEHVKRGYTNPPGEYDRLRGLSLDPESADRREKLDELRAEYSANAGIVVSDLTDTIVEEAARTLPFADKTGPTGVDVAGQSANMASVMDVALGAASAAHAARAASRQPELPRHHVLVEQAVNEILQPSDNAWESDDYIEAEPPPTPEAVAEAEDLDAWFTEVTTAENDDDSEAEDGDFEWGEVEAEADEEEAA
jgi:hypothetical protein